MKRRKIITIIPARYQSSRFPGKPLVLLAGKPMIQWVYDKVKNVSKIDDIYVATDDARIEKCVKKFGGKVVMTKTTHESGTDRIAECIDILGLLNDDIVLNIQGDEPLVKTGMIYDLISTMECDENMGTLMEQINNDEDIANPNIVKVVTNSDGYALYFSRSPVPYNFGKVPGIIYFRHVGVYAYKVKFLKKYAVMQKSNLEKIECLEQIRVLENGYRIKVKETQFSSLGVDTPEQVMRVEKKLLEENKIGM